MRAALLASTTVLGLAACSSGAPIDLNDGFAHMRKSGTFACPDGPVSFDGSHTDVTLTGACMHLRVTGSHNDIVVYVPPDAAIDVTGAHNDVVYRQTGPGPRPQWTNSGGSNTLSRNSRDPSQQDHDWYQVRR